MQWDFVLIVVGMAASLLTIRAIGMRSLTIEEKAELEAIRCQKCKSGLLTFLVASHLITGTYRLAKRAAKHVKHGAEEFAKQVRHGFTKTPQTALKSAPPTNKKLKPSV